MKVKTIFWDKDKDRLNARVMGVSLSVYPNNQKWDARLHNGFDRPETETGFLTATDAMKYAETVLLKREIQRYFTGVDV